MAKFRNITSVELDVRLPDWHGICGPDEAVEVPDDIAKKYAWPETVWESVEKSKRTSKEGE